MIFSLLKKIILKHIKIIILLFCLDCLRIFYRQKHCIQYFIRSVDYFSIRCVYTLYLANVSRCFVLLQFIINFLIMYSL